jgi:hypothetical protein
VDNREDVHRRLREMQAEGGGVWQLAVVSHFNVSGFLSAVAKGDQEAVKAMRHINLALDRLYGVSRRSRHAPMCLFCPAVLWREHLPHAVSVVTPYRDKPRQVVVNFVCPACCAGKASDDALNAAVVDYYRANAFPDLRVLPLIAPVGRA